MGPSKLLGQPIAWLYRLISLPKTKKIYYPRFTSLTLTATLMLAAMEGPEPGLLAELDLN